MYTASTAFLDALTEAGITHIFANWGSDHPALIEAIAEARADGRAIPAVITCPNEMVALSAAHGFAQVSGRPQAVMVHVECGTQALAGAVHNADKGRVPVLIFAGASPYTQNGELPGSRNEFIQWIQDVHDQRGIVRGYMRYDNEIRSGRNIKQLVHRALQFACSDPKGPVYLMGPREVMEEEVQPLAINPAEWTPVAPGALAQADARRIAAALLEANRPLVVTSYVGRNPEAVPALVAFCEKLGIGVLESVPNYVNFPAGNALYLGNQWNHPRQNQALAEADVILVIDSDVPWIPTVSRPAHDARIFHIDVDPLKQQMPLWYIGAEASLRADALTALRQLNEAAAQLDPDPAKIAARRAHYAARHQARAAALEKLEQPGHDDAINGEYVTACIRRHLDDDTIIISEGISHYHTIGDHLRLDRLGSLFTSGGGSLGYSGGAAIGAKLARPGATVIAMCGDGSYMFSVPSSVHWIARAYNTPFLTVIFNNRGWKSPKLSALAVHPRGFASRANTLDVSFDPPPDYAGIAAAAGGAFARTVRQPEALEDALLAALHAVRVERRCAVLDVWVPHL
jgi:acetolactate synthase-1/2/3 large subunit